MIDGVEIKNLKIVPDRRGHLMEILRCDDDIFDKFGQVYMSTIYPGVIKGWHLHGKQSDKLVCVKGMVKLVLFDGREDSATKDQLMELSIGEYKPVLVHIPAGIHYGWKCISEFEAFVIDIASEPYDYDNPDMSHLPHDTELIPYDWEIKMG